MNKRVVIILSAVALFLIGALWLVPRSMFLMTVVEHTAPGVIPAKGFARNLYSDDPDLIRESLAHLRNRKNPIALDRAVELLQSTNDYIWLNAAHYIGVCGRQEAVPYLIKALRHTAWRADDEGVRHLRDLTGEDFGTDFARWHEWWMAQHPDSSIDWTSYLGYSPRLHTNGKGGHQASPAN